MKTIIRKIWVSEKATGLGGVNQYVFLVDPAASKNEIKKEVGRRYGVKVRAVNIIRREGKLKHFGRNFGRRNEIKKAVVTLKEGQKIEIT